MTVSETNERSNKKSNYFQFPTECGDQLLSNDDDQNADKTPLKSGIYIGLLNDQKILTSWNMPLGATLVIGNPKQLVQFAAYVNKLAPQTIPIYRPHEYGMRLTSHKEYIERTISIVAADTRKMYVDHIMHLAQSCKAVVLFRPDNVLAHMEKTQNMRISASGTGLAHMMSQMYGIRSGSLIDSVVRLKEGEFLTLDSDKVRGWKYVQI